MILQGFFFSQRVNATVLVKIHKDRVIYSFNQNSNDITNIIVKRDKVIHFNEDGLNRCKDIFEDPRFNYWRKNNEL